MTLFRLLWWPFDGPLAALAVTAAVVGAFLTSSALLRRTSDIKAGIL